MPRTAESKYQKDHVKTKVQTELGKCYTIRRRPDWLVTSDNKTSVFITFSRLHTDHYFYDVGHDDLREWSTAYSRAFVIFVMGSHENIVCIPVAILQKVVASSAPAGYGDYKLHIDPLQDVGGETYFEFRESPQIGLMQYYNNLKILKG